MDRRSKLNDFYSFVGTLLFGLFALVLISGRSTGSDPSSVAATVGLSGVLLISAFYVLEAGRHAQRYVRQSRRSLVAIPVTVLRARSRSRAA